MATLDDWRALVEKDGTSVDKLVATTSEGLRVQPLYVDGPAPEDATRGEVHRFGVCMRSDAAHVEEDIDGGADAVWSQASDHEAIETAIRARARMIVDVPMATSERGPVVMRDTANLWVGFDPIGAAIAGDVDGERLELDLDLEFADASTRGIRVSGLAAHDAGADAADELALMLASCVEYLRAVDNATLVGNALWLQVSVGRDTFGEICKLRALRACMHKVLAAAGAPDAMPPIHAVCSSRTMTQHDPWTNMLRGTTQIFAAALGGAELITPLPFDASPHARRVARNAALVLREESHLGRVIDPAGGSYYIETRTGELAREAWTRFQAIEAGGGIVKMIASGALKQRLDASWAKRADVIAKRRAPIVGISEFANLDEHTPPTQEHRGHRDSEAFDALRARNLQTSVTLVALGPPSEHRARVGFATALFATAGLRVHEASEATRPEVAVICGSDERYASEAAARARELRAAGFAHVVLAGRPGALENDLREAGVDQFIYIGCDVIAIMTGLTR